jgi:phosphoribosylaminoimidazole carboxylase PurE protein
MSQPKVAILMGSDSDWEVMQACWDQLAELQIPADVHVMSAHRSPSRVNDFASHAAENGVQVIIAGAGMAAALAGTVAACTTLPVIGVPLSAGGLQGIDALLSTVQMPPGVPVATVAIGQPGAKNAAVLAAQIIALHDPAVAQTLKKFKSSLTASVDNKSQALRERLKRG